ncbi:ORF6N domain-containing protein, partial [Clostridioides difficile]
MNNLQVIERNNERVLTTQQLADVYETDVNNIQANFNRNKDRFKENIHYFLLQGEYLKEFKNQPTNSQLVSKHSSQLYLWTERGANRHCKILDTDKAW